MKKILAILLLLTITLGINAQPKREIRAVWLTTNAGMDWPKSVYTASKQQENLRVILDQLAQANFNTIVFQAQVKGDVLWNSSIQPAYRYVTGNGSRSFTYDVSEFVINECHKRGMECHAWIVPYRIGATTYYSAYTNNVHKHVAELHPEWLVEYNKEYYLDPGLPAVREYLLDLYKELVTNYDYDGVNFDYTRYPSKTFADDDSYEEYNPDDLPLDQWRRNNINTFIAEFYDMAKSIKPRFKVGSAPIGTYKNAPGYGNFAGYTDVYQDAVQWMNSGHHDLIIPQMYYNEKYGFTTHKNQWASLIDDRQIVIGLAPYKMTDSNDWAVTEVTSQIEKVRATDGTCGVCFFRTDHVIGTPEKTQDFYQELINNYFRYPAHIPTMPYNGVTTPEAPQNVKQERVGNKYIITWDKNDDTKAQAPTKYYEVYLSNGSTTDIDDVRNIVGHYVTDNKFTYESDDEGLSFAVTAFDENYYESAPSKAAGIKVVDLYKPSKIYYSQERIIITGENKISSVDIYSTSGIRHIYRRFNATDAFVDCSSLSSGLYIAVVKINGQQPRVIKIVK